MPIDMKETIADTVRRMLVEKRVKKLTVKEIVEECHITRQTFYYHFEDIPDMFRWMLKGSNDEVVARCEELPDMESRLRYLFLVALNAEPYVKQSLKTNYAEEIEARFLMRYHCGAFKELLRTWTDEDTEQLDEIVRQCCRILRRTIVLNEK